MLLVKGELNKKKEETEQCIKIKEEIKDKEKQEIKKTEEKSEIRTLNTEEICKNKLDLWYDTKELEVINIEWNKILESIEENKDKKWNIEELQDIDKRLLKEMRNLVNMKVKEFTEKLKNNTLEQNEIEAIRIKYAIFRNKSAKYLVEEILDNQKDIAKTSNKSEMAGLRKRFSDLRRAALRMGIIEKEEYQNNKLNIDIIKPKIQPKTNRNEENILIKINIGEDVSIRYGNNKFSITKKQMREISKYDENKVIADLKEGDFEIIDEEAIKECFNNEIIEPLVIYSIMKSKGIKPFEQAQILNRYLKDGLDIIEDVKFENRTTVIIDLTGIQNSKITSKIKNNIIERAKKLADYNLVKIKEEKKSDIWSKIGKVYNKKIIKK